jgi:hypothetical protein
MTIVAEILDCMSGISKPQRKFFLTLFASMLVTGRRLTECATLFGVIH